MANCNLLCIFVNRNLLCFLLLMVICSFSNGNLLCFLADGNLLCCIANGINAFCFADGNLLFLFLVLISKPPSFRCATGKRTPWRGILLYGVCTCFDRMHIDGCWKLHVA